DVSWNDLACYGNPSAYTPHLDLLATMGVRFDNAYLTTSSCSPSRASIISGRYPHNTGAPELHDTLPAGQLMFPQLLKDAGYYTALSGKNHMGPQTKYAFDLISNGGGPGGQEDWKTIIENRPKEKPFFFGLLLMMHTEIGRLTIQGYHLILIVYMFLRCFMMDQSLVASLRPTTMRFLD